MFPSYDNVTLWDYKTACKICEKYNSNPDDIWFYQVKQDINNPDKFFIIVWELDYGFENYLGHL